MPVDVRWRPGAPCAPLRRDASAEMPLTSVTCSGSRHAGDAVSTPMGTTLLINARLFSQDLFDARCACSDLRSRAGEYG